MTELVFELLDESIVNNIDIMQLAYKRSYHIIIAALNNMSRGMSKYAQQLSVCLSYYNRIT